MSHPSIAVLPGQLMLKSAPLSPAAQKSSPGAVEHVFAHQKGMQWASSFARSAGRARVKIGMANLAYNIRRFVWLRTNRWLPQPKGPAGALKCADPNRGTGQVVAHLAQPRLR